MPHSDTVTPDERKKYSNYAIISSWFGCIPEQLVDSNSLVIIYIVALGGSTSFSMFSTTLSSLGSILLLIPGAALCCKFGLRSFYSTSCIGQCIAFLAMAAAPLISAEYAKYIVIIGCLIYCFLRIPYSLSWLPMLDMFLRPQDRGSFFGKMRFSYMLLNTVLIYVAGKLMGHNPPLWLMQLIIAIAGALVLGRKICMDRMPDNPEVRNNTIDIKSSLQTSLRNAPLVGFSFYTCFLNLAACPLIPLAVIYMKTVLNFGASQIMTVSSLVLAGKIIGYALIAKILQLLGTKRFQILMHTMFVISIAAMCFILPGNKYNFYFLNTIAVIYGMAEAFLLCLQSVESLALARPGNKVMATSFCSTFINLGVFSGRTAATLTLAAGVLIPEWKFFNFTLTSFNFLFMLFLVLAVFGYLFMLLSPAVVPRHEDYYEPR